MIQTVTSWKLTCRSRSKVISASQRKEEPLRSPLQKTRSQEMCCMSSSKEDLCRAAARKMNLGRRKLSTLQQRIPQEKEHTSTVDMELPKVE